MRKSNRHTDTFFKNVYEILSGCLYTSLVLFTFGSKVFRRNMSTNNRINFRRRRFKIELIKIIVSLTRGKISETIIIKLSEIRRGENFNLFEFANVHPRSLCRLFIYFLTNRRYYDIRNTAMVSFRFKVGRVVENCNSGTPNRRRY